MLGHHNISDKFQWQRVLNATATGTSEISSSGADCLKGNGVMFLIAYGAVTADQASPITVQVSSDNSNWDDVTDADSTQPTPILAAADNKIQLVEVWNPSKRYVRVQIARATGEQVIDGVFACVFALEKAPPSLHTTNAVAPYVLNSPNIA